MQNISGKVLLVDPVSPEVNRGSFCYLSYLLHNALKTDVDVDKVELLEEFAVADMDDIDFKSFDHILIGLWSYPQIETCLLINRFLKGKCRFYGYYPLIKHLGLSPAFYTEEQILIGMRMYPRMYKYFNYLLLSDCDQHINNSKRAVADLDKNTKMHPLFTSYGCPMGCAFCSATVNNGRKRFELSVEDSVEMLRECHEQNIHTIHFTDEDFFFNTERAAAIVRACIDICDDWQFIMLAGLHSIEKFMDYLPDNYSPEVQEKMWACIRLLEIGLESADPDLAKQMGKRGIKQKSLPHLIADSCPSPILWLTVTFFPGETVGSIWQTGFFLRHHGFYAQELTERIVTNGTEGGLGQFFQFYHGSGVDEREYRRNGLVLTDRPMRLIPSYIPHSFLKSEFRINMSQMQQRIRDLHYWLDVYGANYLPMEQWNKMLGMAQKDKTSTFYIADLVSLHTFDISAKMPYTVVVDGCIFAAILARLGIIEPVL